MAADVAEEFACRVKSIRAQDDERFKWMNIFQAQLAELARNYKDSCDDLERERIAGRATQKQAADWQRRFQDLQQSIDDGSFVLVLIDADADAYIFKDGYYLGSDGGRQAAWDLQARVKEYLGTTKPDLVRLPIILKAFANAEGMSKFLSNAGIVQPSGSLWDFAKGFSQAHATSDFVLVGNGKDRADKKIEGVFKQFVRNPTCRHIIFGACHDNGYVRMLEDFAADSAVVERVTLLHSFSVGKEFSKLPFRFTKMDTLFRTTSPEIAPTTTVGHEQTPRTENTRATAQNAWAALARSDQDKSPLSVPAKTKQIVLVNAAGHRVDKGLPAFCPAALGSWNHKIKVVKIRYCRMYHLDGSCHGVCGYSHSPLSDDEKLVYRWNLRAETCHTGLKCRDTKCYYRHNCACKKPKCKFSKEMHGIDKATAKVWME